MFLEVALVDRYYEMLRQRGIEIVCMDPLPGAREGLHYFWDLLEGVSDALPQVEHDIDAGHPALSLHRRHHREGQMRRIHD